MGMTGLWEEGQGKNKSRKFEESNWWEEVLFLSESKFSPLGGIKVPAFVNSKLLQNTSGQSLKELFHVTDWLPTLIKLAGGTPPADILDGVDQWNTISQGSLSERKEVLLNIDLQFPQWGLRTGHWKIVKQGKRRVKPGKRRE